MSGLSKIGDNRYFIFQPKEDQQRGIYLPTCKILDRETLVPNDIIGGRVFYKYAAVQEGLLYLDAYRIVRQLNEEELNKRAAVPA